MWEMRKELFNISLYFLLYGVVMILLMTLVYILFKKKNKVFKVVIDVILVVISLPIFFTLLSEQVERKWLIVVWIIDGIVSLIFGLFLVGVFGNSSSEEKSDIEENVPEISEVAEKQEDGMTLADKADVD